MTRLVSIAALAACVLGCTPAHAQDAVDGFVARSFNTANGQTLPYRLFSPAQTARKASLPLVVYLHGSAGAGDDNLKQMSGGNTAGTHAWTSAAAQAKHPAFVIAPQLPLHHQWGTPESDALAPGAAATLELIAALIKELPIDPDRVYLTGQSRGGRGTWDIISKRPEVFAAAVPLCGEGSPTRVAKVKIPVWAFHGAKDEVIPVAGSRDLVAALRAAGAPVKYTEYPDAGHNVWTLAYAEPELPEWLFAQRRKR